jgi:hypothetical protein
MKTRPTDPTPTELRKHGSKPARRFMARIYRIWMMRHVTIPEEVSRTLLKELAAGGKGICSTTISETKPPKYIPVVAIVNGRISRTTLVPAGSGRYRLQINTALRKAAGVDVGDFIGVEVRIDRSSRSLPVPPDLRAALAKHPKARKAFGRLAPGQRRQFILWVDSAKAAETRRRRLARALDVLLERALLSPPSKTLKALARRNLRD